MSFLFLNQQHEHGAPSHQTLKYIKATTDDVTSLISLHRHTYIFFVSVVCHPMDD
jgi:hypothetical protein